MKFAALVLLLAVGSQAASLQADAPDQITQYRGKLKELVTRILQPFDDTTHKDKKDAAINEADAKLGQAIEMGQAAYTAISEATADVRATIEADITKLRDDHTAQAEKVKETLLRHVQQYLSALEPLKEYLEGKKDELDALKVKTSDAVHDIGQKVPVNWQETKESLMPIVQSVRDHLHQRRLDAQAKIEPYIADYMETAKGYVQDPSKGTPDLEGLKTAVTAYFQNLFASLNQN
ncbi:apolipoprotein A-Ib [Acanthochromis polyacanthus]|uniref:Apolipoprotein A-I-1-like n=1 Tax=Acanthochromis polyacanthus TaxID=80966 RepID=A0A3Q1F658_9TELE|nr:apolipoprotein A-Ib [Acanthochromis polyacanthus]